MKFTYADSIARVWEGQFRSRAVQKNGVALSGHPVVRTAGVNRNRAG
jgi:hypothetical protein